MHKKVALDIFHGFVFKGSSSARVHVGEKYIGAGDTEMLIDDSDMGSKRLATGRNKMGEEGSGDSGANSTQNENRLCGGH